MSDLKTRFRALDDVSTPNLWHEIEARATATRPTPSRLPWVLIAVTLLLALALGGAALIGSGIVKLPVLPDGSATHLAYGLDGDIYVADWDGRNPVRIADGVLDPGGGGPAGCGSFWGEGPMWSPDGRHFAYRSAWDGASCPTVRGTVYLSDSAGHIAASFPGAGWLVSWSPDSTRVATWVDVATWADLRKTIGIYGLDGARQALLTMPPGCALPGDFDSVWSPDGRSLVVWPCEVPIDGSTPRPLSGNDPRSHEQWAYSPDGARVAYVAFVGTGSLVTGSLVVAAADGSQNRVLVPAGVSIGGPEPVWSPTGDRIAFDAGPSLSQDEIRIVEVASGKVTSLAGFRGDALVHVIRFSPDGDRILFAKLDANSVGTSLWSVNADGSGARLLVTGTGWGDWQPG